MLKYFEERRILIRLVLAVIRTFNRVEIESIKEQTFVWKGFLFRHMKVYSSPKNCPNIREMLKIGLFAQSKLNTIPKMKFVDDRHSIFADFSLYNIFF